MDAEPNLAAGGGSGGAMKDVRAKFAVDTSQMEKLVKGFSTIKKDVEWMHKNLDDTIKKVNRLAAALGKVNMAQASASEVATPSNSSTSAINAAIQKSQQQVKITPSAPATPTEGGAGAGTGFFKNFRGGAGGGTGTAAVGAIAGQVANLVGAGVKMIDQRTDAGYGPALAADRMGVLYQQMQGISNTQYANQFRKPLQGAMLGPGGVNTLLGLQAQTGLQAKTMMPGVEALRVASGFSLSTQDVSNMIRTMASPMVNNRMTMTMGTGIYGIGGKQRDPMQVVQQITRGAGLTNEKIVESGMQQGSVTRARLTSLGVPEDMQDLVLQYAKENVQYQKRTGGKAGMYDPASAAQRKLMGINKNFATEKEITDVRRTEREEQFYRKQADNYAALERNTQRLIDVFAALEDKLSGLIGGRISTRGNPAGKGAAGIIGAVGTGLMMSGHPVGMGIGAAALIGSKIFGDGTPEKVDKQSKTIKVPTGYAGKSSTIQSLEKQSTFSKLNPKFKDRLIKMMTDNPKVGIGQGYRSSSDQRTMFLSRYSRTKEKTGTFWDDSYWKKNGNVADAAPPGLSMHEIGLAADLVGDLDWVQKNAAKYGLQTFANVNDEPWHVQPAELPRGRSSYEKQGSPWGTIPGGDKYETTTMFGGVSGESIVSDSGGVATLASVGAKQVGTFTNMSISDSIHAVKNANRERLLSSAGSGSGGKSGSLPNPSSSTVTKSSLNGGKIPNNSRTLSGVETARFMSQAGFKGKDLVTAVAIAKRESNFRTGAHNPRTKTKDNSYGLMQINMIGSLGPWRRNFFGIKKDEDLFDPLTNAKAAHSLYKFYKNDFYDWGPYKGLPATHSTNLKEAKKFVQTAGFSTGDGFARKRTSSSSGASQLSKMGDGMPTSSANSFSTPISAPVGAPHRMGTLKLKETERYVQKKESSGYRESPSKGNTLISTPTIIDKGNNITIAPNIYIQSAGNTTADANRTAKEISRMMSEEIKLAAMRSM